MARPEWREIPRPVYERYDRRGILSLDVMHILASVCDQLGDFTATTELHAEIVRRYREKDPSSRLGDR